jgi:hypothetical protein
MKTVFGHIRNSVNDPVVWLLVAIIAVMLAFFAGWRISRSRRQADPEQGTAQQATAGQGSSKSEFDVSRYVVPFFIVLLSGVAIWAGAQFDGKGPGSEVLLPLLVIGGVFVLLIGLGLISFVYGAQGLANKDQALALPEGSVRAVIALSLVLLFGIIAIFLYGSVATSGKIQEVRLTADEHSAFVPKMAGAIVLDQQLPPGPAGAPTQFLVLYRTMHSPAGDDLAKQLIVLLGTLVTAVASFYFGANSVASAAAAMGKKAGPALTGIEPQSVKRGSGPQQLKINGSNLDGVSSVRLTRDNHAIAATDVKAGSGQIVCNVAIDEKQDLGKWDVVVSDGTVETRLEKVLDVTGTAAPAPGPDEPTVVTVSPTELKRSDENKVITLTGENLASVTKVELRRGDTTIAAKMPPGPAGAKELKCTVTIPPDAKLGKWDVVASTDKKPYPKPEAITISAA